MIGTQRNEPDDHVNSAQSEKKHLVWCEPDDTPATLLERWKLFLVLAQWQWKIWCQTFLGTHRRSTAQVKPGRPDALLWIACAQKHFSVLLCYLVSIRRTVQLCVWRCFVWQACTNLEIIIWSKVKCNGAGSLQAVRAALWCKWKVCFFLFGHSLIAHFSLSFLWNIFVTKVEFIEDWRVFLPWKQEKSFLKRGGKFVQQSLVC